MTNYIQFVSFFIISMLLLFNMSLI